MSKEKPPPDVVASMNLVRWAPRIEQLHEHYVRRVLVPQPGSRLEADDERTRPYHLAHEVQQHIRVAVDALFAVRRLCIAPDLSRIDVPLLAAFPLLRAAVENACVAAWLLESDDPVERMTRRLVLQLASVRANDDAVDAALNGDPLPEPEVRARAERAASNDEWHARLRSAGVDVDRLLKRPRDAPSTTAQVVAGATAACADPRTPMDRPGTIIAVWRGLSGASHGDLWALSSLPDHVLLGDPDPITGRIDSSVSTSPRTLSIWTWCAHEVTEHAIRRFDSQRLAFREHPRP
jgi:hypothetical protein